MQILREETRYCLMISGKLSLNNSQKHVGTETEADQKKVDVKLDIRTESISQGLAPVVTAAGLRSPTEPVPEGARGVTAHWWG